MRSRSPSTGGLTGSVTALRVVAALLVAALALPLLHNGYYENLVRGILMFATMSLGWNLLGGYTGYVSFGQVVYFGIGAYVAAFLANHGYTNVWADTPLAMLLPAALAGVLGVPILRLKGHYFGIATLGIALAVAELIANNDDLGGGSGLTLPQAEWFTQYYYAMWAVCVLAFGATYLVARSKFGYALVAIRENEEAAAALGVNPTLCKVAAWALSAAMAGGAGSVFAFANGFIDPSTAFAIDDNVFPIVMALLGGVGTVAGPVVGAIILTAINETLWSHFPQVHTLFFGVAIVLVVLFLPRGLLYLSKIRGSYLRDLGAYRV